MYQALYRRYRPKIFDQVLGQEHITTTLKNQIRNGNVGHAYLFSGTKGTGKTSTAKIFSRAVNCIDLQEGNPCNECEMCQGILKESIIDVIEMDAASNRKIEDIRELREKVVYPPSRTRYKIYIIDEVHMLTNEAFNALLKTLEEPPQHLIFILATTETERLPQTILSRCQRFDFKRIGSDDIMLNMKDICNELGVQAEERALSLIARNSDGAMRDALSLLDQCISYRENLTYDDTLDILGVANMDLLFSMVEFIEDGKIEDSLFKIDEIIQNGKDINQFIKDLIYHFRNLLISKTSKNSRGIMDMDDDTINEYINQSSKISLDFILKALDILNESERQAKWATQPRIILEMAIIRIINLRDKASMEERIERLEEALQNGQVSISKDAKVTSKPKTSTSKTISIRNQAPEKPKQQEKEVKGQRVEDKEQEELTEIIDDGKELSLDSIRKDWDMVLNMIRDENIKVNAFLKEGRLISFSNNSLCIGYGDGYGFHREAVNRSDNKELVERITSSYFKKNIKVNFIMDDEETDCNEEPDEADIQEVKDFFGEDIVEIKE